MDYWKIITSSYYFAALAAAASVYFSFEFAAKHINIKYQEIFLMHIKKGQISFLMMGKIFDSIFTDKSLSWQFFMRSCLASFFWLIIISALTLSLYASSSVLADTEWIKLSIYLVIMGLVLNCIPDYLSLIETRWVLKKMETAKGFKVLTLLLFDLVASLSIFIVPLLILLALPRGGFAEPLWEFTNIYSLDIALSALGYESNLNYFDTLHVFLNGILHKANPTFFLIFVCLCSTLITSVWVWLYSLAIFFYKLLKFTLSASKPLSDIGVVISGFVFVFALAWNLLAPKDTWAPEMVTISTESYPKKCVDTSCDRIEPFEIGRFEVTFNQYYAYARDMNINLPYDESWGQGNRPIINVSYNDALNYTKWLSKKLNLTKGYEFRLPTKVEWEYAADIDAFMEIKESQRTIGNCYIGCDSIWRGRQTAPVGNFEPNIYGLYDMYGNITEWTNTCYPFDNINSGTTDITTKTTQDYDCSSRVIIGRSFMTPGWVGGGINWKDITYRHFTLGFRLARSLE
jgi:sulfatase-modifying factor enzyme 1